MKITKQMKEDFESTRDCWKWLAENGELNKYYWPEYSRLKGMKSSCAFCDYFIDYEEGIECKKCPLFHLGVCDNEGIRDRAVSKTAFHRWRRAKTARTRKKYAKMLYETIDQWCKENL